MKIAYITMRFPVPSETFACLDVATLCELGHDIEVYSMQSKHKRYSNLVCERDLENIKINSVGLFDLIKSPFLFLMFPLQTISLLTWIVRCCFNRPVHFFKSILLIPPTILIYKLLRKNEPDIVHLFWGHYPSLVGYLVYKYLPKTKCSMFLGAYDLECKYPGSLDLSRKINFCFTHSFDNLPKLKSLGFNPKSFNVIHRGIRLQQVDNNSKFDGVQLPSFITASRLTREKGVIDCIKIIQKVKSIYPKIKFLIAGEGPYKPQILEYIENNNLQKTVTLLGHIPQSDLLNLMGKTHFFILMSRYKGERLPNVIKEAMNQECIVVTTNTTGIYELIPDDRYGVVVEQGEINKASDKIISLMEDFNRGQAMARAGKYFVDQNFNVINSMHKYLNIWAGIA